MLKSPEKAIVISVVLLMATGLVFIYSVSGPYSQSKGLSVWYYFLRQGIWAGLALVVLFVCSTVNYRKFLKLSPVFLVASLLLLIMVLFTPAINNVHRWLRLGLLWIQPSEIFKISLLMYLAYTFGSKKVNLKNGKKMWPKLVIVSIGLLLISKEPDLGTMMLVFLTTALVLFMAGIKIRYLLAVGVMVMVIGGVMVFGFGYEKDRIDDYIASLKDPLKTDIPASQSGGYYQTRQSLISIGSGGLIGKGLGGGGQKNLFLPAPHTDFILSASAEEGGFLLCLYLLSLIFIFSIGTLKIATMTADLEGFLLAAGLGGIITLQAVINIGVALGLLPITGMTLPYFSYGGSSLVICCAAAGIVLSVARYGKTPKVRFIKAL
jgi:cell division protein FtsW